MKVFNRICIRDWSIKAQNGDFFEVKRGKEYTTSRKNEEGKVTVFSNFWVDVPVENFGGEQILTS